MAKGDGKSLAVGLAGLGAVGAELARRLTAGIPGLHLAAAATRDPAAADRFLSGLGGPRVAVVPVAALADHADVVVEALPSAAFGAVAQPAVEAGRLLVVLSVGALLNRWDLVERAAKNGARIIVPTGALLGLDAVRAAAEGVIRSARMITRKPPEGLEGAPYLVEHGISLRRLKEPLKVFEGSAREGVQGFPANVNVAVALSLAGVGPDRTRLEIWADPAVTRNTHTIEVDADSARFRMTIENVPSENPRTGRITALSAIATLRGLTAPLRIGT